jgi:hypothetical protein
MSKLKTRLVVYAVGGIAIVALFFFGTLFLLDLREIRGRNAVRAENARSVKAALEKYRATRGTYPFPFSGGTLDLLKPHLVDGGYLRSIPTDPLWRQAASQYSYVSTGGATYGLLIHLETMMGASQSGTACITGLGTAGTGWWGQPPECPF